MKLFSFGFVTAQQQFGGELSAHLVFQALQRRAFVFQLPVQRAR